MIALWRERCLNTKYPEHGCKICRDRCLARAITPSLEVDAKRCTNCGLCLSACPAEAIGLSGLRAAFDRLLRKADDPLVLVCEHWGGQSNWPCLGTLDGRLLFALIYRGSKDGRRLVLQDSKCAQCNPGVAAHIAGLKSAVDDLMIQAGNNSVFISGDAGRITRQEEMVSRRAFFSELLGAAVTTVQEVAFATADQGEPITRQELFRQYAPQGELAREVRSPLFCNIDISQQCNACRACLEICPTKALTAKDGGSEFAFSHNPLSCRGCSLCAARCPMGALSLIPAVRLDNHPVATRKFPHCRNCGEIFQPTGGRDTCLECLLKANSEIALNDKLIRKAFCIL